MRTKCCKKTLNLYAELEKAVKEKKVHLVIVAADSSDRTKKTYRDMCDYYKDGSRGDFSIDMEDKQVIKVVVSE